MKCVVCNEIATETCSKCHKIKYCSKICQLGHWKIHRIDCYPLKIETSDELGRYLVASKNLKQWEVILKEKPIVSGPSDSNCEPLCLGCFAILKESSYYKCSSCKWPVCDSKCEKSISHADFECRILTKQCVRFTLTSSTYRIIHVLRGLLMKDINIKIWNEIISLQSVDPNWKTFIGIFGMMSCFDKCVHFIRDQCKLIHFEPKEIEHVLGAIAINSFASEDYQHSKPRSGAYLYKVASMSSHSCIPNCYRMIDEKSCYQLRASIDIPIGTPITTFYIDTWTPTQDRQFDLKTRYSFICSCPRCMDPTELGTYFSGIKCNTIIIDSGNCYGYLIPIDPQNENSQWECNKCKKKTEDSNIRRFNCHFKQLIDNTPEQNSFRNYQMLDNIAVAYQRKVHPNHYILLDLEFDIAEKLHNMLSTNTIPGGIIQQKQVLNRLLNICQHQIEILDILRPGYAVFRGKVLNILQYGKMVKLLITKPKKPIIQQEMKEIEALRATALTILSIEPAEDIRAIVANLKNDEEILSCKLALGI